MFDGDNFFHPANAGSVLLITLDSCRYDSFAAAMAPNMKSIGELHRAMAPGNFTYASHAAMFMGFTPGVPNRAEPFVNPKFAKIFKMAGGGFPGIGREHIVLGGRNVVDGFNRKGYATIGTGAVGWFNPDSETGRALTDDFQRFFFPGDTSSLGRQLLWLSQQLADLGKEQPAFVFLNIGETHVPYYYGGAPWSNSHNPCVPFSDHNDASECRRRQVACVEWIDEQLHPILKAFELCTTVICADHGDCWGEDGLWEHGICHEKVLEVPLLMRISPDSRKIFESIPC